MQSHLETKEAGDLTEKSHPRRWWILGVLCLCVLMVVIEDTIVNLALPTLALELAASGSELQWIVESYVLVKVGLLLAGGILADRFGSRRMLVAGLIIFGATSLIASFAGSALFLIGVRVLMGLGGALIMPATLSTLRRTFSASERPKAIGIWASIASLGIVIGPTLGGWLIDQFWWGAIFLINVPLVALAIPAVLLILPGLQAKPTQMPFDLAGMLLAVAGITSLVFGIIEAQVLGWSNPLIIGTLAGGVGLLALFIRWELRTPHPMLDVRLFRNRRLSAASLAVSLTNFALFGTLFFLSQYLQFVLGYGPLETGIRFIPMAIAVTLAGLVAGWLLAKLGNKLVVAGGLFLAAIGLAIFSTASPTSGYELVLAMLVITSGGLGLVATAATDSVMSSVPPSKAGAASGIDETALELGGAMGIAVLGSVTASTYASLIKNSPAISETVQAQIQDSLGSAVRLAAEAGGVEGQKIFEVARLAFIEAMNRTTLLGAGIILLGVLIALLFLPARASSPQAVEGQDGQLNS